MEKKSKLIESFGLFLQENFKLMFLIVWVEPESVISC